MTERHCLLLLLQIFAASASSLGQYSSPYSLQAAVDALHRRESRLALGRDNLVAVPQYLATNDEYWDEDQGPVSAPTRRQQLNRLLAKYLAREEDGADGETYENEFDDSYGLDERKRSFFRERDGNPETSYPTVFREREIEGYQPELAEEFLRQVAHEQEVEREEKYREALRRLWEKYQQQENEIEQELFEEEKKKRQPAGSTYMGPIMEKKRPYPVLPWLPASRKKRFPVAKRSPKAPNEAHSVSGTDEKVAKDLQAIFGQPEEKKKRSSGNEPAMQDKSAVHKSEKKVLEHDHGHAEGEEAESDEHEHDHEAHEHDEDEDDHDFDDEEDEDRKKKREVKAKKRSTQEVVKEDQIIPGDLSDYRKKKSIQWSKYFGMDRRKKSEDWFMNRKINDMKKRSTSEPNEEEEKKRKKKDIDQNKLDNMDHKLKSIEDLIIDETVKYTGAHEGINDPDEIRRLKDHVVSRLATAYSLEKMRRALDKLRQSVDNENHLENNEIGDVDKKSAQKEKEKRVAVKKEKVDFDNNHHPAESPNSEKSREVPVNGLDQLDDDKKKRKKKRNGIQRYPELPNDLSDFEEELGAGHFEPLNDVYLGSKNYGLGSNQCPLLDTMEERCRGVDMLSGDIHQDLLPVCGVHQLCYLCGTSLTACDFQYLSEADSVCGHNSECQSAARAALMILRGSPGPQLGPRECLKNSCLYRAMRDIGL